MYGKFGIFVKPEILRESFGGSRVNVGKVCEADNRAGMEN